MNRIAKNWSCSLARILVPMLVLWPILMSMQVTQTEATGSRENDLWRNASRIMDFNGNEEDNRRNSSFSLTSQSSFDFFDIKRSLYTVNGNRLEIGIEWTEGHDFDIWCGDGNAYEADCENHEFQVDFGNGLIIDKISFIDMWEEYLTIHIELGENVVECNQVITVSYVPSGKSSVGDPPDVPFSIDVSPKVDWLD